MNRLGQSAYGALAPTLEYDLRCLSRRRNSYTTIHEGGTLVGGASVWPVTDEWAAGLKAGVKRDLDMDPERDVCEPHLATSWYWAELIVALQFRGRGYAHALVGAALESMADQIAEGPVEILALTVGDASAAIFADLGFKVLRTGSETRDGWPLFARRFGSAACLRGSAPRRHPSGRRSG
jgi:GNAT superfamily N-acetyltransferase